MSHFCKDINTLLKNWFQSSHISIHILFCFPGTNDHCVPRSLKWGLGMAFYVLVVNCPNSQKTVQQIRFYESFSLEEELRPHLKEVREFRARFVSEIARK